MRLNWGLEANYIITLLEIIVLNQIVTFPACCFPIFHLGTRISFQDVDFDSYTQIQHLLLAWLTSCCHESFSYTAMIFKSNSKKEIIIYCIMIGTGIYRTSHRCTDLLLSKNRNDLLDTVRVI